MASTSGTGSGVEIRKFDGKNFALWKEMMQDVLIIRRQVEAIRQKEKPESMKAEEWKSLDEIARSTIRMHLAKKCLFQHGERDDNTLSVGEATGRLREEIVIFETDFDQTTVQYEDERD